MYSTPGLPAGDACSKPVDPAQSTMAGKRIYQVWKGSNRFFLGGRLIFGPDARSLLATLFLILAPIVVFCIFVGRHLMKDFPNHAGIAITVVAVVHTFCVLVLLLLTSGRDPGIVPRSKHPPEPEEEAASSSDWSGAQTPRLRLPRTKDVMVNNMPVKVKYCDTCMLYRPPRCSHCSICNNCVERFDHHCPWVGQCIGRRNYPYFFTFVLSATILCFYIFAMSALRIKKLMEGDPPHTVWKALQRSPASAFLMAYAFLATWFVGGLTMFHLYLISTNQTTYENFRYRYDNKVNPYNQGVLHNFKEILCSRIPPSKNNFRARVEQDDPGCVDAKAQQRDNPDMFSPNNNNNNNKSTHDSEVGSRSMWTPPLVGSEGAQNLHSRSGSGIKHIYDDVFAEALGKPLPYESSDTRSVHARGSSRGRESGKWDISPELLGLSSAVGGEGSQKLNNAGPGMTKNR